MIPFVHIAFGRDDGYAVISQPLPLATWSLAWMQTNQPHQSVGRLSLLKYLHAAQPLLRLGGLSSMASSLECGCLSLYKQKTAKPENLATIPVLLLLWATQQRTSQATTSVRGTYGESRQLLISNPTSDLNNQKCIVQISSLLSSFPYRNVRSTFESTVDFKLCIPKINLDHVKATIRNLSYIWGSQMSGMQHPKMMVGWYHDLFDLTRFWIETRTLNWA